MSTRCKLQRGSRNLSFNFLTYLYYLLDYFVSARMLSDDNAKHPSQKYDEHNGRACRPPIPLMYSGCFYEELKERDRNIWKERDESRGEEEAAIGVTPRMESQVDPRVIDPLTPLSERTMMHSSSAALLDIFA